MSISVVDDYNPVPKCNEPETTKHICVLIDTFLPKHCFLSVQEKDAETEFLELQPDGSATPNPRLMCDLLGGTGLANAVCAFRCLLAGFGGGYCNDQGECICRH